MATRDVQNIGGTKGAILWSIKVHININEG